MHADSCIVILFSQLIWYIFIEIVKMKPLNHIKSRSLLLYAATTEVHHVTLNALCLFRPDMQHNLFVGKEKVSLSERFKVKPQVNIEITNQRAMPSLHNNEPPWL